MQQKIDKYTERIEKYGYLRDMRNQILDAFSDLKFYSVRHEYNVNTDKGLLKLPSVSNIIHQVEPVQDWDNIALHYGIKNNMSKEEVLQMWKWNNIKATNSGSNVHTFGEACFYFYQGLKEEVEELMPAQYEQDWLFPNSPKEEAVIKFWEEEIVKNKNIIPILSESKVYSLKYGYAGTFDLLFYDTIRKGLLIKDYKTNEDIYKNFNNQMLLAPFDDLLNCSYSLYTLQLSSYQIPLEDLGLNVIERQLIWLKDDGSYELLNLESKTHEIRNWHEGRKDRVCF